MAVLSPPFALGAAGVQHSARLDRLSLGAVFTRGAGSALGAASGALPAPPGGLGELTLVNPTTLRVNPALWVVQGTHSADQGQYVVPNDAAADLAVTGQHASQFRRSLAAVSVADSQAAGVGSSPATDRAWLQLIDGPLSATAPAPLPATPPNTLLLGEVAIPPVGQAVTLTPYNPRTGLRGGILPVIDDALGTAGHAGAPGVVVGQARDHPTWGLERWTGGGWAHPTIPPVVRLRRTTVYAHTATGNWITVPMEVADLNPSGMWDLAANAFDVIIRRAGIYRVAGGSALAGNPAAGRIIVKISKFFTAFNNWQETGIGRANSVGGFEPGAETNGLLFLDVNDRVRLDVFQDTGGNINLATAMWQPTFLEAEFVRSL